MSSNPRIREPEMPCSFVSLYGRVYLLYPEWEAEGRIWGFANSEETVFDVKFND
jgi:hypothetical protein